MPGGVYLLCAGTSLMCAVMLFRGYANTAVRLLFWSGLCFVGLALDNLILYLDVIVVPDVDITLFRRLPGLAALILLIFALIWESK